MLNNKKKAIVNFTTSKVKIHRAQSSELNHNTEKPQDNDGESEGKRQGTTTRKSNKKKHFPA